MKKFFILVIFFLFFGMTLFAQVSFGDVLIRDEDGVSLITYGFTNTYEEINTFTLREFNGTLPRTVKWESVTDIISKELKNEMNTRNINFAFRTEDADGRILLLIWRRVGKDFFNTAIVWNR